MDHIEKLNRIRQFHSIARSWHARCQDVIDTINHHVESLEREKSSLDFGHRTNQAEMHQAKINQKQINQNKEDQQHGKIFVL